MSNPNPDKITNEMWRLWEETAPVIPGVQLGGIYAFKPHYHSSVIENQQNWPNDYSIKLDIDLKDPKTKARAIDLTMSNSEMVKWTKRMKTSAEDPDDPRLGAVREFYGTIDNKTVFGLIKDNTAKTWRKATSDTSHLWHGHTGLFTFFVNNWVMLEPILSVWKGETFEEWSSNLFPKKNDESEEVRYWQFKHNLVRNTVSPASPEITVDNIYGPKTVAAFTDFAKKSGAKSDYVANQITAWLATKYDVALIKASTPKPPAVSPEAIKTAVDEWLRVNTTNIKVRGTIEGNVTLP